MLHFLSKGILEYWENTINKTIRIYNYSSYITRKFVWEVSMMLFMFIFQIIFALLIIALGIVVWRYNMIEFIGFYNQSERSKGKPEKVTRKIGLYCILSGVGLLITAYFASIAGFGGVAYVPLLTLMITGAIFLRLGLWLD